MTLHKEIQLYRTLSTMGTTATTFAHESLRRCHDELQGSIHPARKAWRTLVRVDDVSQDGGYCHVVVPAWNPHQAIRIYFRDIPPHVLPNLRTGLRVHAKVNIGAERFEDVYFDEWEPE